MKKRRKIVAAVVLLGLCAAFLFYVLWGQEYLYAKKYADQLFGYELPEKTEVIEQDFGYGVLYGGGPWGSGGRPTIAAYQKISTKLSEQEIFQHYHTGGFEIYFEGTAEQKMDSENQIWFEGEEKSGNALSSEKNDTEPIEVIIQYRTEFSYPFFIDLH